MIGASMGHGTMYDLPTWLHENTKLNKIWAKITHLSSSKDFLI